MMMENGDRPTEARSGIAADGMLCGGGVWHRVVVIVSLPLHAFVCQSKIVIRPSLIPHRVRLKVATGRFFGYFGGKQQMKGG